LEKLGIIETNKNYAHQDLFQFLLKHPETQRESKFKGEENEILVTRSKVFSFYDFYDIVMNVIQQMKFHELNKTCDSVFTKSLHQFLHSETAKEENDRNLHFPSIIYHNERIFRFLEELSNVYLAGSVDLSVLMFFMLMLLYFICHQTFVVLQMLSAEILMTLCKVSNIPILDNDNFLNHLNSKKVSKYVTTLQTYFNEVHRLQKKEGEIEQEEQEEKEQQEQEQEQQEQQEEKEQEQQEQEQEKENEKEKKQEEQEQEGKKEEQEQEEQEQTKIKIKQHKGGNLEKKQISKKKTKINVNNNQNSPKRAISRKKKRIKSFSGSTKNTDNDSTKNILFFYISFHKHLFSSFYQLLSFFEFENIYLPMSYETSDEYYENWTKYFIDANERHKQNMW